MCGICHFSIQYPSQTSLKEPSVLCNWTFQTQMAGNKLLRGNTFLIRPRSEFIYVRKLVCKPSCHYTHTHSMFAWLVHTCIQKSGLFRQPRGTTVSHSKLYCVSFLKSLDFMKFTLFMFFQLRNQSHTWRWISGSYHPPLLPLKTRIPIKWLSNGNDTEHVKFCIKLNIIGVIYGQ